MTAQTTTSPAASGIRVAPMIVVIIAILAFGAGLALAQVIAPNAARSAAVPASAPALTFDAPLFRAQERAATLPVTVAAPLIGGSVAGNDGRHNAVGVTTVGDSLARDAGRHR